MPSGIVNLGVAVRVSPCRNRHHHLSRRMRGSRMRKGRAARRRGKLARRKDELARRKDELVRRKGKLARRMRKALAKKRV